jgi:hypothetical protein
MKKIISFGPVRVFFAVLLMGLVLSACKKDDDTFDETDDDNNGGGGSLVDPIALPFSDAFEYGSTVDEYAIGPNWLEAEVSGSKTDRGWAFRPTKGFNSTGGMLASAFGGEAGNDNTFLITGPFDLSSVGDVYLGMLAYVDRTANPGTLKVKYSENYSGTGDPGAAAWTELTALNSQWPTAEDQWEAISTNLNALNGAKTFIAFHFEGGTSASSIEFRFDSFVLSTDQDDMPTTAVTVVPKSLPFTDNFNYGTTVDQFAIPTNWLEAFTPGSATNRGWAYRPNYGTQPTASGNDAMIASAFVGASTTGTDSSYLVCGPFNFNDANNATVTLKFKVMINFLTNPGNMKVQYSSNYAGSGNPKLATWTDISYTLPTSADVWQNNTIDLSAVTGEAVYIGFYYYDGTAASAKAFRIDDFELNNF